MELAAISVVMSDRDDGDTKRRVRILPFFIYGALASSLLRR